MKALRVVIFASLLGAVAVTLTPTAAGAGGQDRDAAFAQAVCSALLELRDHEDAYVVDHAALDGSDPTAFQREAVALAQRYIRQLKAARAQLSETEPSGGDQASKPLDTHLGKAIKRLRAIVTKFADADPGAPGFQADVATFEANLQFLNRELPDPFERIRDQDLLAAFGDEPTCGELVVVAGG